MPKTDYQRCMVHNRLKYVASKDMKSFAADLNRIYNAAFEDEGLKAGERDVETWSSKDVRKIMYTTNAIESLNSGYRKLNRHRSVFPSDKALLKALNLTTFEATKKMGSADSQPGASIR